MIVDGERVRVAYEGRTSDGLVVDSSRMRKEPFDFLLGSGEVILGLDRAVSAMSPGEKRTVHIPAAQAFGLRDEALVVSVPLSRLAEPANLTPGSDAAVVIAGVRTMVTVLEVGEGQVVLDCNHPLAGKDLTYDVELVSVVSESAIQAELHGEGCTCGCHRLKDQLNARLAS